jgi:hypothetical protein
VNASNEGNARKLIKICSASAAEDLLARHSLNGVFSLIHSLNAGVISPWPFRRRTRPKKSSRLSRG